MERMALPSINAAEVELPYYLDKTWVQCESTACMKWRLISRRECEGLDPNQPWYCHMNQDPLFSHCLAPEGPFPKASQLQKCGLEFKYSRIPVGSLVMVKASRWPRWPAVLSTDPDSAEYVQEDYAGNVVKYHVEFLGSPHSRLWVSAKAVQLYQAAAAEPKNLKDSLQQSFKVAMEEAAKMAHITCEERLQQCLFKPQDCER
ncbi:hypothetical protein GJAV_G00018400 [Gymnothorax javanicus]|nr:hypothetical protein GJAV_G00018400 [Gymnothorax javanicus]